MTARVLGALIALVIFAAPATSVADKRDDQWVPPGLSNEERAEWKNGRPPGWSKGAKKGWRGRDCPPGQAKKGRCPGAPRTTAAAAATATPGTNPIQDALERLREWARNRKLSAPMQQSMLTGFEGAVAHGVPVPVAERLVTNAAERSVAPSGIEVITRALAYGAQRGAPPAQLESFAQDGLNSGVAADAIALGLYRLGADAKR
ncbi:MAG: hypothetical protein HYU41_20635 [Candidatus Rokubacteria bacterium]|nr:hypothetical protein [Candidatus Rokubacteria bacterium]